MQMRGHVICPLCGHRFSVEVTSFHPFVTYCEDPEDGGCGEYFVAELMELIIEGYKIEGRSEE
jgi:hypothetical protein